MKILLGFGNSELANRIFSSANRGSDIFTVLDYLPPLNGRLIRRSKSILKQIFADCLESWSLSSKEYLISLIGEKKCSFFSSHIIELLMDNSLPISLRERAAESLNEIGNDEAILAFLEFLASNKGSNELLTDIIGYLGELDVNRAVPPLKLLLEDPKVDNYAKLAAILSLAKIVDYPIIPALKCLCADSRVNESLLREAIILLGESGITQSVTALLEILREWDINQDLRLEATLSLGRTGDVRALPYLSKLIEDTIINHKYWSKDYRFCAADAICRLKEIDPSGIIKSLYEYLAKSNDSDDRLKTAATYLCDFDHPHAFKASLRLLNVVDRDSAIYPIIVLYFGYFAKPDSYSTFIKLLKDEKTNIRVKDAAARALGRFRNPKSITPLLKFLKDEYGNEYLDEDGNVYYKYDWLRTNIIFSLADIGGPRASAALFKMYDNSEGLESYYIIEALRKIGDSETISILKKILKRSNFDDEVYQIALSLYRLRDYHSIEYLIDKFKKENEGSVVKQELIRYFGESPNPLIIRVLLDSLFNNTMDSDTRINTYKALGLAIAKVSENRWPDQTIERIRHLVKESIKTGRDTIGVQQLRNEAKRRLIFFGETKQKAFAKMWDNDAPNGKLIDKIEFNKIFGQRFTYDLLIIDDGHYERNLIGEVYLGKTLMRESKKIKEKEKRFRKHLTPREYRLLVFTLRNNLVAGLMVDIVRECLGTPKIARELNKLLKEDKKYEYHTETSKYRNTISNLNSILYHYIGMKMLAQSGNYMLKYERKPKFCLIERS